MKVIISCILIILVIEDAKCRLTADQFKNALKMARNVCQPKTKVANDQIDSMKQGNFVEDPNLMCYMECVLTTARIMKDGKVNEDGLQSQINAMPEDLAELTANGVAHCRAAAESNADKCKAAYTAYKCFYEFAGDKFFLP